MKFGSLEIAFDGRVLEPRPWTLAQARWAQELEPSLPPGKLAELGCGAGHIGLAALQGNARRLVQLDSGTAACDFARRNAAAAGLSERVEVRCGDFDRAFADDEEFALVLADPPYVPTSETWRYPDDPPGAIDGGVDGLEGIRAALDVASAHLAAGGAVLLQVWGEEQAHAANGVAESRRLHVVEVRAHDERRAVALLRRAR